MKCQVTKSDLLRELKLMVKVVPGRNATAQPALASILIQAHNDALMLTATDLNVALVGACAAEVKDSGSILLPAIQLFHLVKAQSEDKIELQTGKKKGEVVFRCGKFRSSFQTFDIENYPTIPSIEGESVKLNRVSLKYLIPKVSYAVGDKNVMPVLYSVRMELPSEAMRLIGASAQCLSVAESNRPEKGEYESAIIPVVALNNLVALLNEPEEVEEIEYCQGESHIFFEIDGRLFVCRRMSGEYPNYRKLMPDKIDHTAEVKKAPLASVLKRLVLINSVVDFTFDKGVLSLSAADKGESHEIIGGQGEEELDIEYEGPKTVARYSGERILNFLTNMDGDIVSLGVVTKDKRLFLQHGEYQNVIVGRKE